MLYHVLGTFFIFFFFVILVISFLGVGNPPKYLNLATCCVPFFEAFR